VRRALAVAVAVVVGVAVGAGVVVVVAGAVAVAVVVVVVVLSAAVARAGCDAPSDPVSSPLRRLEAERLRPVPGMAPRAQAVTDLRQLIAVLAELLGMPGGKTP